jgi:peptidoglycan/LPS O-acetylase OafA/YrhL
MIEFKYRPDVDGLRAVAVCMVLLFHAELGFPGGYVGVDIFFVISGFLITGVILKEQQAGTFSLVKFWMRRVRRIVPAAAVMMAAVLLAGFFVMTPSDYAELGESALAHQLMASNVYFWRNSGYFAGPSDTKPLLHTWSLAIEEQFYLGYPFLLVFLRKYPRRAAGAILGFLALASLALSQYALISDRPSATFYLLPTRAWELLCGGLICFAPHPTRIPHAILALLSWSSVVAMLAAGLVFDSGTPFPGLNALLPCGAAAVFIFANSGRLTLPASLLAARPVVFVGLISYSLYLWHWPIVSMNRYWHGTNFAGAVGVVAIGVSFAIACLSWRFIERPFLRAPLRDDSPRRVLFGAAATSMICLLLSCTVLFSGGARFRASAEMLKYDRDVQGRVLEEFNGTLLAARQEKLPQIGVAHHEPDSIDFVLWGDSHARMIGAVCDRLATESRLQGIVAARSATGPFLNAGDADHQEWNNAVFRLIKTRQVRNVILAGRWEAHFSGNHGAEKEQALYQTVASLRDLGVHVWILDQVPLQTNDPNVVMFRSAWLGREFPRGVSLEEHDRLHAKTKTVFANLAAQGATLLTARTYCFDHFGRSRLGDNDGCFYWDDDHLSPYGAEVLISPVLRPVLSALRTASDAGSGAPKF